MGTDKMGLKLKFNPSKKRKGLCKSDNVMSGLDLSPFLFFEGLNFNFNPILSVVGSHLYPNAVPDNFAIASSSLEPLVTNVLRDNPILLSNLGIVPVNWFVRGSLVPIILDTSAFDPPECKSST